MTVLDTLTGGKEPESFLNSQKKKKCSKKDVLQCVYFFHYINWFTSLPFCGSKVFSEVGKRSEVSILELFFKRGFQSVVPFSTVLLLFKT